MVLDKQLAMKVSIPLLSNRISPVFDESRTLLLVEIDSGKVIERRQETLQDTGPPVTASYLIGVGVNVLICSAISWPLERRLLAAGIQVIPHTCGPVEEVLSAYLSGQLTEHSFLTPGCLRRRCRCQSRSGGPGGRGRKRRE
jgi:predicted Fe-Mo cluster-binding NifX family protein